MTTKYDIESNVKLIAIVGAVLFATLISALIVVQQSLGSSQKKLAETVVPLQQQLGKIAGAEGAMFLRQSEIIAANNLSLQSLGNRDHHEDRIRNGTRGFRELVSSTGLEKEIGFPAVAADSLEGETEVFLKADDDLYLAATRYQNFRNQFSSSIDAVEKDLRALIEASSGMAGVFRLEHMSHLRKLSLKASDENVDSLLLRPLISGNSRSQLDTISQLDTAVLRLGVLAGKVGLAANEDSLNSLEANELIQNREQIMQALVQLRKLVTDDALRDRLQSLQSAAIDLSRRVGDESLSNSLASLHRQKLREEQQMYMSRIAMASVSERLEGSTEELRSYLQKIANVAKIGSAITIERSRRVILCITMVSLVLGVIAAFRIRKSVLALREQNARLSELSSELTQINLGLEQSVIDRTASLQLVLDSTGDGLIAVGLDGKLLSERSKAIATWFGLSQPGDTLWDYLVSDVTSKESLKMAFEQIAEGFLPFQVAADQAPKSFVRNGRTYTLEYREVREKDKLARILVLMRDVTAELAAKQVEREMLELHTLVGNLLKDRDGFDRTLEDCTSLIVTINEVTNTVALKHNLHTLKGNCATVGFYRVADFVNELECRLGEENRNLTSDELINLDRCWHSSLSKISTYLNTARKFQVEISSKELEEIKQLIDRRAPYQELGQLVSRWQNEPSSIPLSRLANQAKAVAERLGKNVEVSIEDNHLRIPEKRLRRFWSSMIHVVRNAIDHGIEPTNERTRLGKHPIAKLKLSTRYFDQYYEISIADDGCGIDWQQVRRIAERRGLPSTTDAELMKALFCDGVSTRETATEVSGRGIGLGAVRSECEKVGGIVDLESWPGKGTRFVFRFSEQCLGLGDLQSLNHSILAAPAKVDGNQLFVLNTTSTS